MNFDGFYPFVLPYVGNCPTQTVDHHLRQAAITFCQRAQVWVESLDTLIADAYRTEYALPLDDQVELVKLLSARIDDRPIDVLGGGVDGIERRRQTYLTRQTALLLDRRTVQVLPAPADGSAIDLRCWLKPSQTAFSFPDEVFAHDAQTIAHGALGALLRIPGQAWSEFGLADFHDARFKGATDVAARKAERANARATPRSPASRFY